MDLPNRFVWIALATLLGVGAVGFADDWVKVTRRRSLGLTGRGKLVPQFLMAFAVAWAIEQWAGHGAFSTVVSFPFLKKLLIDLGILYIPFVALVVVGSSNAVNLTDGLDGLAIGAVGIAAGTYAVLAYVTGNAVAARYLQIPFIPQSGELAVFCGALVGASLGFLWFNCHPAEVIMGDVGALSLGAAIAAVAVMTKQEMLLAIVGGLFVLEALSVIIQVASFKSTGRRVFKMAPAPSPFRADGLGRVAGHHPVLDPRDPLRRPRSLDAEAAMSALPMTPSCQLRVRAAPAADRRARLRAERPGARRGAGGARASPCRSATAGPRATSTGVESRSARGACGSSSEGPPPEFLAGADWLAVSPGRAARRRASCGRRGRGASRCSPSSRSPGASPRPRRRAGTAGSR